MAKKKNMDAVRLGRRARGVKKTPSEAMLAQRRQNAQASHERAEKRKLEAAWATFAALGTKPRRRRV